MRAILGQKKRCLYVVPFVSIVTEKEFYLQELLQDVNIKIGAFHSGSETGWTSSMDLAICTIEKASSLVNKLIEEQMYDELGFMIIDEFHLLMDSHRGYLLESLVSKIKFLQQKSEFKF